MIPLILSHPDSVRNIYINFFSQKFGRTNEETPASWKAGYKDYDAVEDVTDAPAARPEPTPAVEESPKSEAEGADDDKKKRKHDGETAEEKAERKKKKKEKKEKKERRKSKQAEDSDDSD